METRDNAGGDESRFDDDAFAAEFAHDDAYELAEESEHDGSLADTRLHHALRGIADQIPPMRDPLSAVLARAAQLRRRRRTARAVGTVVVLAAGAAVSPALFDRDAGSTGPDIAVAAPPSAVSELPSASSEMPSPVSSPTSVPQLAVTMRTPVNLLGWPSRGATAPDQVLTIARMYLMTRPNLAGGASATNVEVRQLWALQEGAVAAKPVWLFIGEGWTSGPDGTSQAYLIHVEWDGSSPLAAASAAIAPTMFSHPAAGAASDPTAVGHIAEISFTLSSGRLLVLGAPPVKRILYSASGGQAFVDQKAVDGVALFQRAAKPAKSGAYLDEVQVRGAGDVALTPPGGWSAGDYDFSATVPFDIAAVPTTAIAPPPFTAPSFTAPSSMTLTMPWPTTAPTPPTGNVTEK